MMKTLLKSYFLFLFLIFFISCFNCLKAQNKDEAGRFPVYNFSPKTYNALAQNWDITQDKRGIMYFGNNHGVLEYDGVNWRLIRVINGSTVKSLDVDDKGRIFVGAENEFGYLLPDSIGRLEYRPLSEKIYNQYPDFGSIWEVYVTDQGVVFQTYNYLFIWKDDSIHIISSKDQINESFFVAGTLFTLQQGAGLTRLDKDKLLLVPGAEIFSDKYVYGIIEIDSKKLLIATANSGLYMLEYDNPEFENAHLKKIKTKIEQILEKVEINDVVKINNNLISLGTWGDGAIIMDTSWNLITIFDKSTGIQDQVIQGQYVDNNGNLWFALSNGISRLEINSPVTVFNDQLGLSGRIESVTRFHNTIYAATNRGLYYLTNESLNERFPDYKTPVFKGIERLSEQECWKLITFKYRNEEILLVVTNNNIIEIDENNHGKIVLEEYPWVLYQSKLDSARVYVGLEDGLTSIYREKGKWINERRIEGINEDIRHLSEDYLGNLWMGTLEQGVIKLHIVSFKDNRINEMNISKYDSTYGLPEGPFVISQTDGPTVIGTNKGLYKFELHENRFIPDSVYGIPFADGSQYIHRITERFNPYLWMVTYTPDAEKKYHVGYLKSIPGNQYEWVPGPFSKISEGLIHTIIPDTFGVIWFGGDEGLYRYDSKIIKDYAPVYHAYLRDISYSDGGQVFGGTYFDEDGLESLTQPEQLKIIFPYSKNSLVFNYASQTGEDEKFLKFSYFLEGNDKRWSDWTGETKKEYTNLHEGRYIFRVKAKNIYGQESTVATYEYIILAPWFRKWWAFILYLVLATAIVYIIVKLYTRQLRQIIRERTAEVVRQKDEIEKQKEEIEHKNNDIMDSIRYAKKIQTALLPPEQDMSKLELDGFILFLPRDIVSGDFYWLGQKNGKTITVAADCTGHGVPGAFMSMLGITFLNNIIGEAEDVKANEILNRLRRQIITHLRQKGQEGEQKDGMDLAMHIINKEKNRIEYAGANNPLILIRNDEIIHIKADRMPIGIHERADEPFQNNEMEVFKGDVLYTFSDGYQDQFGGSENKKFMIKNLKELFVQIYKKPMEEQKEILRNNFYEWIKTGNTEQIDDVIVIGVRI